MSWADYSHVLEGFKTCETCAIKNLKFSLDYHGDEYDETDLLTLERTIALVDRLNAVDGIEGDDEFAPKLFDPEPGEVCVSCQAVSA